MELAARYGERGVIFDASGGEAAGSVSRISSSIASGPMFVHCSVGCGSSRLGWCEQRLLGDHQIGQGEQGVELGGVLGQPAIT